MAAAWREIPDNSGQILANYLCEKLIHGLRPISDTNFNGIKKL